MCWILKEAEPCGAHVCGCDWTILICFICFPSRFIDCLINGVCMILKCTTAGRTFLLANSVVPKHIYTPPTSFKNKKKTVNVWVNRVVVVIVVNQKVWLMKPPSSLEFPLTFLGWVLIFSGTIHYLEVTEWNDRGNLLAQMAKKCHSSKN